MVATSPLAEVPFGVPIVVVAAAILAYSTQTWINSLLGGDQGLGAFLSNGTGFNNSGFKERRRVRRPMMDGVATPDDPSAPLGGPDPLPWLKLPEFDYVDVAGQPAKEKKPKVLRQPAAAEEKLVEEESEIVIMKLEALRGRMKDEVEAGDLQSAKRTEDEMLKLMKDEGYDYST